MKITASYRPKYPTADTITAGDVSNIRQPARQIAATLRAAGLWNGTDTLTIYEAAKIARKPSTDLRAGFDYKIVKPDAPDPEEVEAARLAAFKNLPTAERLWGKKS